MKLRPLEDRIVVKPVAEKEKEGDIIIPETASEKSTKGEVLAVGPGKLIADKDNVRRIHIDVKVGDTVVYTKFAGHEIDDVVILEESDILAIIEKGD